MDQPAGIPAAFDDHVKLMFDLQVLAYQCDLTRVITLMLGREISGRTFPEIGVHEAHHPTSHHNNDQTSSRTSPRSTRSTRRSSRTTSKSSRRRPTATARCSITCPVYGYGMADGNAHAPKSADPAARGRRGRAQGRAAPAFPAETPLANLHLTLLDKLGVPIDKIGDSTGKADLDTLSGV